MNIIEKLKSYFPTEKVVDNSQSQPQANYIGGNPAIYGDHKSDGSKWLGGFSGSGNSFTYDHSALRKNSRQVYQDSTDANSLIKQNASDIAFTGLRLNAEPDMNMLGITPEFREKWSKDVNSRYHLWASDKKANRSESMTPYQMDRLKQIERQRDGEYFQRLYYSKDTNLQNPLQIENIDPEQIHGDAYTSTYGPIAQDDGIQRDERGREKSYKIWTSTLVDGIYKQIDETIPRVGRRSGKVMMIHGFAPEYAGQKRGIPALSQALQDIQLLTDLKMSHIKKAINQSNYVMAVENNLKDPGNFLQDNISVPTGGSGFGIKATTDPATASPTENDYGVNVARLPQSINEIPGSTAVLNTTQGDKIKMLENTAPVDGFEAFYNVFITSIAASTGSSIEKMQKRFSTSFSAARGSLLVIYDNTKIERNEMTSDSNDVIYEMWLGGEIAAGRVSAPGWQDPRLKRAWLKNTWIGSAMPNIDPFKTAKGIKEELSIAATTGERTALELNGSDFNDNIEKNKKSFAEMPVLPDKFPPAQEVNNEL